MNPTNKSTRPQFILLSGGGPAVLQTRLTADNRFTFATRTKVRIGLTPRVASRLHSRPVHSPSLPRPQSDPRKAPSLASLFKGNLLVTRLSTAAGKGARPVVSWITGRRSALVVSAAGSAAVLNTKEVNDTDLSQSSESENRPRARGRSSVSLPPTSSKPRTEERVSFKEACRDFEWLGRAKDQLQKDWQRYLRLSNGVTVTPPSEAFFAYKYYLGRGNNHPLVKACFRARGHWTRLKHEEDMAQANLVWTQSKVKSLFATYPTATSPPQIHSKPGPILCSVKFPGKKAACSSLKPVDIQPLGFHLVTNSASFLFLQPTQELTSVSLRTHNKLEHNYHLANKKTLFYSMKKYYEVLNRDPFQVLPLTFHIQNGPEDAEFARFQAAFRTFEREKALKNIWIVKPGENTNRGTGISVCSSLEEVKSQVNTHSICPLSGQKRTFILQKYIETPLLIHKRKFDIRCYGLLTAINTIVQGYYYKEGYLRTSSKEFSLKDVENRLIHLTNDAIQKYSEDYGKFESGNKLSYSDFQRYLDLHYPGSSLNRDILPQIRQIMRESFEATFAKVNFSQRLFSFEVLGYDFMVDSNLQVWLIEVNTNPCLELSSPLLARIIPAMLDNAFRIAIDPYFPDPVAQRKAGGTLTGEPVAENRFELVFHSGVEGKLVREVLGERFGCIEDFDKTLQDMPEEEEMDESNEASEDGC